MRVILFLFVWLFCCEASSQPLLLTDCTNQLPKKKVYFVGQGHYNQANTIIEKELLFALNKKYKLRYAILEYGHSIAFLLNQYLESGVDSLLKWVHPEAPFTYIRAIKKYNDSVEASQKIRFYGIDFENRNDGKYTRKAIEWISDKLQLPEAEPLAILLQQTATAATPADLKNALKLLKTWMNKEEARARKQLSEFYTDLLLMVNAQFDFSPRRDDAMFQNFTLLYQELVKIDTSPSFLASFGTGHINPNNKNGIAMQLMLESTSVVHNDVAIIGVQYYRCYFGKENVYKTTFGSLDFLCNKSIVENLQYAKELNKKAIRWIPNQELQKFGCKGIMEKMDGMLIMTGYEAAIFGEWQ